MNQNTFVMKNLIALALLFATAFGVLALGVGAFKASGEDEGKTAIDDLLNSFDNSTTKPTDTTTKPTDTTTSPDVDHPVIVPEKYADNLSGVFIASGVEGLITDRTARSIENRLEKYQKLSGLYVKNSANEGAGVVSVEDFDPKTDYIVADKWENSEDFTCGTHEVESLSKVDNEHDGGYTVITTYVTREKIAVTPYMGYILYTYKNEADQIKVALCLPSGEIVIEDIGDKIPAYCRDFSNDPVFTNAKKTKYYALRQNVKNDVVTYTFESVKQEKVRVGLYYDYPATPVGLYQDKYELSYRTDRGFYLFYNYKTNSRAISSHITYGFNFTEEGLAVVQRTDEDEVWIINTNGRAVIRGSKKWVDIGGADGKLYAVQKFILPKTFGIESMGCQGFDRGWLRVLVQIRTAVHNTLTSEKYILIDQNGDEFDIPTGYSLEGYSDGVLLLEKDGRYGYYSIDGYWIAQPIYTYARPFVQGLGVIGFENGTVGMVDEQGNIVMPFVFTYLSDVSSGRIVGYCEGAGFTVYTLYRDVLPEKE